MRRTLGEGSTPLLSIAELSDLTGFERLYLKVESKNPTGSHKDRFHAVSVAVAASLGMRGVVATSTGNHGLAMATYAAAQGLQAVVIAHPRMPLLLQRAIRFAGGLPLLAEPEIGTQIMREFVETHEWMPAATVWPMPFANPYGIEGYKSIAAEVVEDLDGEEPAWMLVPTAGGDLLCGIWRGLLEEGRARGEKVNTRLCACQPANAAPLVNAIDQHLSTVPRLEHASSVALSIGDPVTGDLALDAIRDTNGAAIAVPDDAILAAGRMLASAGILVEPSSAAPLAALRKLAERHPEARTQPVVCILTSSALKWLDDYGDPASEPATTVTSAPEALALIDRH